MVSSPADQPSVADIVTAYRNAPPTIARTALVVLPTWAIEALGGKAAVDTAATSAARRMGFRDARVVEVSEVFDG